MRAAKSKGPSLSFLSEKSADRALIRWRFERVNEIAKSLGEHFRSKFPVVSHSGRDDVMSQKALPAFPELPVHQSINIMKMNCLERFQELIRSVKKARTLFNGERGDIFEADPPDAFQVRIFHERLGHVAQGRGSRVLRGEPGHARAPVHLQREV